MFWILYVLGIPLAWDRADTDNSWVRGFVSLIWPIIPFTLFLYWAFSGQESELENEEDLTS